MSIQTIKDQIMNAFMKMKNKRLIIGGIILVLLALGSLAFIKIQSANTSNAKATKTVTTSEVKSGDLTVEISGTGNVVAVDAIDLAFSTQGKVAELNANPGKSVAEGDVLAKLDRITSLKIDVDTQKLALVKAQKALDDLETNKEIKLANALLAQSDAAAALEKAQYGELNKYSPRCEKNVTEQYYYDYMYAKHEFNYWNNAYIDGGTGYGTMYILQRRAPYILSMNQAYVNWKYCEGYSELEMNQSKAKVETTSAAYLKAQDYYKLLESTGGIDPDELTLAETTKKNAELQLEEAQRILDGATLVSPMDGTVISVAAAEGESLDKDTYKSSFIQIADLSNPVLKASFDETDLSSLNTNCAVQATFASLANKVYEGRITQINPSLATTDGVSSLQVFIELTEPQTTEKITLPIGLSAAVELNCTIAQNVLIVPLQALKEESDGKALVYVLNTDGTSEARSVTVGKKSSNYAEILGDISVGDKLLPAQSIDK
jgi:RND family efflux transporter MFP subunit